MLLNGVWQGSGTDEKGKVFTFQGLVPGCVHTDLLRENIIEEFYSRDNSQKVQWIENQNFTYTKEIFVEALEENAYLEFDGLDTYCKVFLNGQQVGESDDMFIPVAFAVDGVLRQGSNTVEVHFTSPIKAVEGLPQYAGAFTRERMNTRRIQCTYSWDWVDRFVTMGIFRDVRLTFRKPNSVDHVYVVTKSIFDQTAQLKATIHIRDFVYGTDSLSLCLLDPDGNTVYTKKRKIWTDTVTEYIDIPHARLWYPNGYGDQPLYTLIVSTENDEKRITVGVRMLRILQLEDQPDSDEKKISDWLQQQDQTKNSDHNEQTASFIVEVNGLRIFCKGADWVPCEPFPSAETEEKIRLLLKRSKDAYVNMVRVWGGGIFEQDAFYDWCDRYGILVSQDFLMACGTYPEEREWFIEALKREAAGAALRLRNHACLAWWSGDNENAVRGHEDIDNYPGFRSASYGIEPVLRQLDPERAFLPSSPYGGKPYCSATRGTTHNTFYLGPYFSYVRDRDFTDWTAYNNHYLARFDAEEPAIGMPFVSSLRKFLTDEDIFGDDTSMSEFHTKNNPGLGKITLYMYVDLMTKKLFGEYTSGRDRVRKMQMLQCEKVRISMELFRRNKWYSAGILYWMLNDCWPAANGWSLLDYYTMPKPAYYLFKRSAKPVIASLEEKDGAYRTFVCNDGLSATEGTGKTYLYDFDADTVIAERQFAFSCPPNTSVIVQSLDASELEPYWNDHVILLCDITAGQSQDRAFWIKNRYMDLALTYAEPTVLEEDDDTVTVTASSFLPYAMLDVPCLLEENCFPLKKGEVKKIKKIKEF